MIIIYCYNFNAILVRPLRSRKVSELAETMQETHECLAERGCKPNRQTLDNETSLALKECLKSVKVTFQLVPQHAHRRNEAKRAMRAFKNNFIAILCRLCPYFPLNLWYKLLHRSEINLNTIRSCKPNPKILVYQSLEGQFACNHTPLATLESRIIAHDHPTNRQPWAPHGNFGWLIGPAIDHYRCFIVFNLKK